MTLEEIIKKITEFLKGIYRSEEFAERFITFVTSYILTSLIFFLVDWDDGSIITNFWEGLIRILSLDPTYSYGGRRLGLRDDVIEFILITILFLIFYFVSRTLYRFIIKRVGR